MKDSNSSSGDVVGHLCCGTIPQVGVWDGRMYMLGALGMIKDHDL